MDDHRCCNIRIKLSELLDTHRDQLRASIETAKRNGAVRIAIEVDPDATVFEGARIFCESNVERSVKEHLHEIGWKAIY